MLNSKWTGGAGTDHWNVCVSHSFPFLFFRYWILDAGYWILRVPIQHQESRIEYRISITTGAEDTRGPTLPGSIREKNRGPVCRIVRKYLADLIRTCASPACWLGPRIQWHRSG